VISFAHVPTNDATIDWCFHRLLSVERRKSNHASMGRRVLLPRHDNERDGHEHEQRTENSRNRSSKAW
jgi:hypothetical protein